jgi:hypothetical protein
VCFAKRQCVARVRNDAARSQDDDSFAVALDRNWMIMPGILITFVVVFVGSAILNLLQEQ